MVETIGRSIQNVSDVRQIITQENKPNLGQEAVSNHIQNSTIGNKWWIWAKIDR